MATQLGETDFEKEKFLATLVMLSTITAKLGYNEQQSKLHCFSTKGNVIEENLQLLLQERIKDFLNCFQK